MSLDVSRLRPGDTVRVRSLEEIRNTLGGRGALHGLPFMPEMAAYCGREFRIAGRVLKVCCERPAMEMRAFKAGAVFHLENLRCSGKDHGGCQNNCRLLWREEWVVRTSGERPADSAPVGAAGPAAAAGEPVGGAVEGLAATQDANGRYYCQATELPSATVPLTRWTKIGPCVQEVVVGNRSVADGINWIARPAFCKVRRWMFGEWPRGSQIHTPVETLNLQPGEWVEVKSLAEITKTLDSHGKNRGLHFSEDMAVYCGKRYRVRTRLDRLMIESTGCLRSVKDTVVLDDAVCGCVYTFGGCSRGMLQYWREIWLRRVQPPVEGAPAKAQ